MSLAHQCGIKAVIGWDASIQEYGPLATWNGGEIIKPGDIILLHFRHNMENQIKHIVALAQKRGIKIAQLENYL